jgi:hypothetical protein
MTVLTFDQAKRLAPRAFGQGAPSPRCDLCGADWTDQRQPQAVPHGPFFVWCCPRCAPLVSLDGAA